MSEPITKIVEGDGIKINLAVWKGTGKPILCVHGITANCRCWDAMASVLAPHQIIAMDLRGRGQSDKPPTGYSMAHHVQDIHSILDTLKIEKIVLMGHSLGAFIALAFGVQYPERVDRIILVDGAGKLSPEQFDKVFEAIKPALDRLGKIYPSSKDYIDTMKSAPYIQPWSDALENYYRYELEEAGEGGVRTNIDPKNIMEESVNVRKVDVEELYPKINCEVLILRATKGLFGLDDLLLPEQVIEKMLQAIPRASRFDVEGAN
ncbi:MAG: alpha/beta hydrolase, partial [Desulfobacterales bacterium]|nr:alpha/beta hydrolase [Desulfobacterales bacterium]